MVERNRLLSGVLLYPPFTSFLLEKTDLLKYSQAMSKSISGYYPVNLDIAGKKCLVVGGGKVAVRKVRSLLDFGASVVMVSPDAATGLRGTKNLRVLKRKYRSGDTKGAALVIAATDDEAINRKVSEDARKKGVLVNVVDQPKLCSFIVPASVRRGRLTISVSTGGASPSLAGRIRGEIERRYGDDYGKLADVLGELRTEVVSTISDPGERRSIFERMSSPAMLRLLRKRGKGPLRAALERLIRQK